MSGEITSRPYSVQVLLKLLMVIAFCLAISLLFYMVTLIGLGNTAGPTIFLSMLSTLPMIIGAIFAYVFDPYSDNPGRVKKTVFVLSIASVFIAASLLLREGIVCILMLAPFWLFFSWIGVKSMRRFQKKLKQKQLPDVFNLSILAVLPFLSLLLENQIPMPTQTYRVEREVIIEASAEQIWPRLQRLENIQANEGRWTITQNLLRIPRPKSAIVSGEGLGAVRSARWGNHITFEEHITQWTHETSLRWVFKFPNTSVQAYTDRHISPNGFHLKIQNGGYYLYPQPDGKTRLVLDTWYQTTTPINGYSALWGELILGDIQNNVLKIIKDRAEN